MCFCLPVQGQQIDIQEKAEAIYAQSFDPEQALKNGKQYGYFYPSSEGRHFMHDAEGSIHYDGNWYHDVDLYYDMYNQLVLVRNYQGGGRQYLIPRQDYIKAFEMEGQRFDFFRHPPDSSMTPGFYAELFNRKGTRLFVKRNRELDQNRSRRPGDKRTRFVLADEHYLLDSTGAHIISNKKELFEAMGNNPGLLAHIKSRRIRLRPKESLFTEQIVSILDHFIK